MQHLRAELAVMLLDAHIGAREQRSGEGHECGQGNQEYVELVDEKLFVERDLRPRVDHAHGQHHSRDKGAETHQRIQLRCPTARAEYGQQQAAQQRGEQQRHEL